MELAGDMLLDPPTPETPPPTDGFDAMAPNVNDAGSEPPGVIGGVIGDAIEGCG